MTSRKSADNQIYRKTYKLIIGGLHREDFEWASRQHEENGYVLVAFLLDYDGYHWKAVYSKISDLNRQKETA